MKAAREVKKLIRELKGQPSWLWADLEKRLVGVVRACQRANGDTYKDALTKLVKTIEAEPLAVGEPAESVQIGRLQVVDEIRATLAEVE